MIDEKRKNREKMLECQRFYGVQIICLFWWCDISNRVTWYSRWVTCVCFWQVEFFDDPICLYRGFVTCPCAWQHGGWPTNTANNKWVSNVWSKQSGVTVIQWLPLLFLFLFFFFPFFLKKLPSMWMDLSIEINAVGRVFTVIDFK